MTPAKKRQLEAISRIEKRIEEINNALAVLSAGDRLYQSSRIEEAKQSLKDYMEGYWHSVILGNSGDWRDILYPESD